MPVSRLTHLAAAVLTVATVACSGGGAGAHDQRRVLAEELGRLGLWRDLPGDDRASNVAAVADGVHPWSTALASTVEFAADGEHLAEGGVEAFLAEVRPALEPFGIDLRVANVRRAKTGEYVVRVNGEVIPLYDAAAWNSPVAEEQPSYAATMRPLAVLNRNLTAAGVSVRFFVLHPGANDGVVLLIDPKIVEILQQSGLLAVNDLPVEATWREGATV